MSKKRIRNAPTADPVLAMKARAFDLMRSREVIDRELLQINQRLAQIQGANTVQLGQRVGAGSPMPPAPQGENDHAVKAKP